MPVPGKGGNLMVVLISSLAVLSVASLSLQYGYYRSSKR
jgi:hypothetical protein